MRLVGISPLLRFDTAMTTAPFEGDIRFRLAPTLLQGQVVIADNLTAHHCPAICAAIEERGARFLRLPAYSPGFNPIEEAFSNVEQFLRDAQAGPATTSAPLSGAPSTQSRRATTPAGSPTAAFPKPQA